MCHGGAGFLSIDSQRTITQTPNAPQHGSGSSGSDGSQPSAGESEPATPATTPREPRNAGRRGRQGAPAVVAKTYSITITLTDVDVVDSLVHAFDVWLKAQERGVYSLERGPTCSNLHVQGVVHAKFKSAQAVNGAIKRCFAELPPSAFDRNKLRICVKTATNRGLHTFAGLCGYCMKDPVGPAVVHNVDEQTLQEGARLFMELGCSSVKSKIALLPSNLLTRIHMYSTYRMRDPSASFCDVLMNMCSSGTFYPSADWCIIRDRGRVGLDLHAVNAVWCCLRNPGEFTRQDLHDIFFSAASNGKRTFDRYFNSDAADGMAGAESVDDAEALCIYS